MTRRPSVADAPLTRREALAAEREANRHRGPLRGGDGPVARGGPGASAGPAAGTGVPVLTIPVATTRREARAREPLTRPRRPAQPTVPRIVPFAIALALVVGVAAAATELLGGSGPAVRPVVAAADDDVAGGAEGRADLVAAQPLPTQSPQAGSGGGAQVTPDADSTAQPTPDEPASAATGQVTAEDALAGILSTQFPTDGTGRFSTVPGDQAAPSGPGRVRTFRVQVEQGLAIDGPKLAAFVYATLNDPHGWGAGGTMRFARTDGASDFRVVLATPDTSAQMCLPLRTGGTLSCRNGQSVVLTIYRWVRSTPDYGENRTAYRHYLVSHETGHFLGHGHVSCPGPGKPAPVMMQQTKGLDGCAQNPWPNP